MDVAIEPASRKPPKLVTTPSATWSSFFIHRRAVQPTCPGARIATPCAPESRERRGRAERETRAEPPARRRGDGGGRPPGGAGVDRRTGPDEGRRRRRSVGPSRSRLRLHPL